MQLWCQVLYFCGLLLIVYGSFDCRRQNTGCWNGGTCSLTTGICDCTTATGYQGYDCNLPSTDVCSDDPGNCLNGSTCYETDKCYCASGMAGKLCNESYAQVICDAGTNQMKITVYFEKSFDGYVYIADQDSSDIQACSFTPKDLDSDKKIVNESLTIIPDDPAASGCFVPNKVTIANVTYYQLLVVIQYNKEIKTSLDKLITIRCEAGTTQSLSGIIENLSVDDKTDLTGTEAKDELSTVVMSLEKTDGSPLTEALHVGEEFFLTFTIIDTDVYNTLIITSCTANDTNAVAAEIVTMDFLAEGCPTPDGASFIKGSQTTATNADGQPQTKLKVSAFKFLKSTDVGFTCDVEMCEPNDTSCGPKQCPGYDTTAEETGSGDTNNNNNGNGGGGDTGNNADNGNGGGGDTGNNADNGGGGDTGNNDGNGGQKRRKRDTANEKRMTGIVTVIDPYSAEKDVQISGPGETDCQQNPDLMALIVVMAAAIFILFVACFIMTLKIIRSRTKVHDTETMAMHGKPQKFHIPRAKLCNDTSRI